MAEDPEVEAVITRSRSLMEEGLISGVSDVSGTAIYLATSEVIEDANLGDLVRLIREGIDEESARTQEELVRGVAFAVLLFKSRSTKPSPDG